MTFRRLGPICIVPLVLSTLALGLLGLGCSGGDLAKCGNGKREKAEQCDCGTDPTRLPAGCTTVNGGTNGSCSEQCRLRAVVTNQVTIQWTINGESILGSGSFDSCSDVGATYVRVRLVGAGDYFVERTNQPCGEYVVSFTDDPVNAPLPVGTYTIYAELQNAQGSPLAPAVDETFDLVAGPDNQLWIDFPLEAFYDYANMDGDLLYRLSWGTLDTRCAMSVPVVATQEVTLSQGGTPLSGYPASGVCSDSTVTVLNLAPGAYDLRVEGFDATSTLLYCLQTPLKVGAGVQPAYQIVVPTLDASGCE